MSCPVPPAKAVPSTWPGVVHGQNLAARGGAILLDRLQRALALRDLAQRLVHGFGRRLGFQARQGDVGKIRQGDVWQQLDLDIELKVARFVDGGHLDLGLARRAQAAIGQHLPGGVVYALFQHFRGDRAAVAFAHEVRGHLAGAEAGKAQVARQFGQALAALALDVGGRDHDGVSALQPVGEGLGDLHRKCVSSPMSPSSLCRAVRPRGAGGGT